MDNEEQIIMQEIEEGMAEESFDRMRLEEEFIRENYHYYDDDEALRKEARAYASNCL